MRSNKNSSECIGIVGLGLIGGSLGLDLQSLGFKVHGLVHRAISVEKAQSRGLADLVSTDPSILSDCDVVFIALPLDKIIHPSTELISALPEKAVITDVGSVKTPVLKTWEGLHKHFVGSHPMAGTSDAGIEAGRKLLFKNRPWVSTPTTNTDPADLQEIENIAKSLGSHWITAEAELHDQAVALVSHMPVVISAALLRTLGNESNKNLLQLSQALASSGFSDTTRIGGGNPSLGKAMVENNPVSVLKALEAYKLSLAKLEQIVLAGDWSELQLELEKTETIRPKFIK